MPHQPKDNSRMREVQIRTKKKQTQTDQAMLQTPERWKTNFLLLTGEMIPNTASRTSRGSGERGTDKTIRRNSGEP